MTDQQSQPADARPTIVLVHGAFTDHILKAARSVAAAPR